MSNYEAYIQGGRELHDALKGMPEHAEKILLAESRETAKIFLAAVMAHVPVDTGLLRESFQLTTRRDTDKEKIVTVKVRRMTAKRREKGGLKDRDGKTVVALQGDSPSKYARMLERGTRRMPAKPFFRPAFEQTKEPMVSKFTTGVGQKIQRHWDKGGK